MPTARARRVSESSHVVGAEAAVAVQPEAEDPAIQELLDFHELAFETVFGRDYDGTESAYFFEQPLDESTYATVVPGWNTVGEPVDALVLLAQPIDVSDFADPGNGVTIISAAHIAGTLEGVEKQGFWGISMVYDFSDGVRYNDLFLLQDLDETTEKALMAWAGLLEYNYRGDPDEMEECTTSCEIALETCMRNAEINHEYCGKDAVAFYAKCCVACTAAALVPGFGLFAITVCIAGCSGNLAFDGYMCNSNFDQAVAICYSNFRGCMEGCGWILAEVGNSNAVNSPPSRITRGDTHPDAHSGSSRCADG